MTHPKLILKRIEIYKIHLQLPSSKYALTRRDEFGHYRSFWKVNKNTFFVKASYMNMEHQNDIRPKGLVRGCRGLKNSDKFMLRVKKALVTSVENQG